MFNQNFKIMKENKIKNLSLKKITISKVYINGGSALPTTKQSTVVFTGCVCESLFCNPLQY
jgi:hypothetical protein